MKGPADGLATGDGGFSGAGVQAFDQTKETVLPNDSTDFVALGLQHPQPINGDVDGQAPVVALLSGTEVRQLVGAPG